MLCGAIVFLVFYFIFWFTFLGFYSPGLIPFRQMFLGFGSDVLPRKKNEKKKVQDNKRKAALGGIGAPGR